MSLLIFLVTVPTLLGLLALFGANVPLVSRGLLLAGAVSHALLSLLAAGLPPGRGRWDWGGMEILRLDNNGTVFLLITTLLFLMVSVHTLRWLGTASRLEDGRVGAGHGGGARRMRENIFVGCLLIFLGTMTLVTLAGNFGVLWVAVEATTLASAPLICFHHSASSLEAMWKYLLICSVGIGLALFGTMLAAQAAQAGGVAAGLNITTLIANAERLNPTWFKAAFVFVLAGYGTKMGLAPFHTWLPDAHSEAPAPVSALLSGALLNCSFLGILRFTSIAPSGLDEFCRSLLFALGLLSVAVAAFFIVRQVDYKRMLAYSSVEHMGLAALLWSVAGERLALLHLAGHSLIKMLLFLTAGNILLLYGTRSVKATGGMFSLAPRTAVLWMAGLLLIVGTPPSPLFVTEFLLVGSAGPFWGTVILLLLLIVFAGMAQTVLKMTMGAAPPDSVDLTARSRPVEKLVMVPVLAGIVVILVGILLTATLNVRL